MTLSVLSGGDAGFSASATPAESNPANGRVTGPVRVFSASAEVGRSAPIRVSAMQGVFTAAWDITSIVSYQ
ncbi:MAG: hypothetical protein RLW61_20265 [Gammaproteobacteria bacterium]